MAHYTAIATTDWPIEVAFEYLASFENVAEWDPGVSAARCITGDSLAQGAKFEVKASFLGRDVPLVYETLEIEAPDRVVLRAESATVVSLDTLTFVSTGDGTEVTYDAELSLKGPLKIADPLLGLAFDRLGDRARDGLVERLRRTRPAPRVVKPASSIS